MGDVASFLGTEAEHNLDVGFLDVQYGPSPTYDIFDIYNIISP
jgi:hypothetical protein